MLVARVRQGESPVDVSVMGKSAVFVIREHERIKAWASAPMQGPSLFAGG